MKDLVYREGVYYKKFSEVPFTGKTQGSFKDGKWDGPWVVYNEDGTVWEQNSGTFKNGVKVK